MDKKKLERDAHLRFAQDMRGLVAEWLTVAHNVHEKQNDESICVRAEMQVVTICAELMKMVQDAGVRDGSFSQDLFIKAVRLGKTQAMDRWHSHLEHSGALNSLKTGDDILRTLKIHDQHLCCECDRPISKGDKIAYEIESGYAAGWPRMCSDCADKP